MYERRNGGLATEIHYIKSELKNNKRSAWNDTKFVFKIVLKAPFSPCAMVTYDAHEETFFWKKKIEITGENVHKAHFSPFVHSVLYPTKDKFNISSGR